MPGRARRRGTSAKARALPYPLSHKTLDQTGPPRPWPPGRAAGHDLHGAAMRGSRGQWARPHTSHVGGNARCGNHQGRDSGRHLPTVDCRAGLAVGGYSPDGFASLGRRGPIRGVRPRYRARRGCVGRLDPGDAAVPGASRADRTVPRPAPRCGRRRLPMASCSAARSPRALHLHMPDLEGSAAALTDSRDYEGDRATADRILSHTAQGADAERRRSPDAGGDVAARTGITLPDALNRVGAIEPMHGAAAERARGAMHSPFNVCREFAASRRRARAAGKERRSHGRLAFTQLLIFTGGSSCMGRGILLCCLVSPSDLILLAIFCAMNRGWSAAAGEPPTCSCLDAANEGLRRHHRFASKTSLVRLADGRWAPSSAPPYCWFESRAQTYVRFEMRRAVRRLSLLAHCDRRRRQCQPAHACRVS